MPSFSLIPLPEDRFTVDLNKKIKFNLLQKAITALGGTTKLALFLRNNGFSFYSQKQLTDSLNKWQNNYRRIPLDFYLFLSKITTFSPSVKGLILKGSRNPLFTKYPLKLTPSFAFVSELIRVEGHLTKKKIVLENTNTELTQKFKRELFSLGIIQQNIKESLHIKIQIPENVSKKEIKILNTTENKPIENFHERTLSLTKGVKKEIIFIENHFSYNKELIYNIKCQNASFLVKILVPSSNKIFVQSTFDDIRYQKSVVSLKLEIHNKTLIFILHNYFAIPFGEKSRIITIPSYIQKLPKPVLQNLINATLAAESTIATSSRRISFCSLSPSYLKNFQSILLKFNILSKIRGDNLYIYGNSNFQKIAVNFDFIIKSKKYALEELLKIKEEQFPKNLSKLYYLKALNELDLATAFQIRSHLKRRGNSFRKHLLSLKLEGYISVIEPSLPKRYFVTPKGKTLLEQTDSIFLLNS